MGAGWRRSLRALAAGGLALSALGLWLEPERAAAGLLLAANYVLGLGLGALCFLVLVRVTGGAWATAFRRVPEALAATIPLGALVLGLAFVGMGSLYEWTHADVVAKDEILRAKSGWLSVGPFLARAVLCVGLWWLFASRLRRASLRQDEGEGEAQARRARVLSAGFLPVLAVTLSVASFDWLMSLDPHWYSTMFAWLNFAGLFTSALALMIVLLIVLRRRGPLSGVVRDDHLHDLAKLAFAFATFWAYLWFCQYMLIWYSNIPEEATWFVPRQGGAWGLLLVVTLVLHWLVPFVALLPRAPKRREGTLLIVAVVLLLGRWLDLFVVVGPTVSSEAPALGPFEVVPTLAAGSLLLLGFERVFGRHGAVPRGDPALEASLAHHA